MHTWKRKKTIIDKSDESIDNRIYRKIDKTKSGLTALFIIGLVFYSYMRVEKVPY